VPSPSFIVKLADLEQGPRSLTFVLSEVWLRSALESAGAVPRRDGSLAVRLEKYGPEVMVRGRARASVSVACVVTLDPVEVELEPEIFLLLRKKAEAVGSRPAAADGRPGRRRRRTDPRQEDPELGNQDAGRDTFQGDEIVLDDFVREFLLLEVPPYPRCPDLPSAEESIVSRPLAGPAGDRPIDPRLEPLAALAARLRGQDQKE